MSTATAQNTDGSVYYIVTGGGSVGITETITALDGFRSLFIDVISDLFVGIDANADVGHLLNTLKESWLAVDANGQGDIFFQIMGDKVTASEALKNAQSLLIFEVVGIVSSKAALHLVANGVNDACTLSELISLRYGFLNTCLEKLSISAALSSLYEELLSEHVTYTPKLTTVAAWYLVDRFTGQDTIRLSSKLQGLVKDKVLLRDAMLLALPAIVSELLSCGDSLFGVVQKLVSLVNSLVVQGDTRGKRITFAALQEAIELVISSVAGYPGVAREAMQFTSTLSVLHQALCIAHEIAQATDSAHATHQIFIALSDRALIIDPPTGESFDPTQLLNTLVTEQISFTIGWVANDGVYEGYVVNTNTNAVSQYQGWSFNSFAEFYGRYLGASATQGLAQLGGSADGANPILATLQTAVTDFGSGHQKRVRSAYLGIAAEGTCYLQVLTDDNVERIYQLVANAPGLGNQRVDMARGVQSRYWSFSLESTDGSAWRLDNLEVLPVVLSRRVR